jgi:gluconolactonase
MMIPWFFLLFLFLLPSCVASRDLLKGEPRKLVDGFRFTEGPACDAKGNIYFSDIPNNRIHVWSIDNKLSTFSGKSGGANGLYFDGQGNLLACEGKARRVTSIDSKGNVTTLAAVYNGKKLNSPNDLWIDPRGGVYFTDPRYGKTDGMEQDGFHVYYIVPDRSKVVRVISDLVKPNGIIGTSDGKLLYVADPGDKKTYVYEIKSDGLLGKKKLFAPEGSDGMTLDANGNLYLTNDKVVIYSSKGKRIGDIAVPEKPANVCFGGKDRRTLFITARKSLYTVEMNVAGMK